MTLHYEELPDGRRIAFTDSTRFMVQTGRGHGYKTTASVVGSLSQALTLYTGTEGEQVRLYSPDMQPKTIIFKKKPK